jgi:hypothetical protein
MEASGLQTVLQALRTCGASAPRRGYFLGANDLFSAEDD